MIIRSDASRWKFEFIVAENRPQTTVNSPQLSEVILKHHFVWLLVWKRIYRSIYFQKHYFISFL